MMDPPIYIRICRVVIVINRIGRVVDLVINAYMTSNIV